ncbi:MAG: HAD-IIB family hydrolase, partial [Candidatus Omnitrophica bacterium]|nr:HAD-IIB family hydrolase [Candidatus Omnitrophota bacterium]
MFRHGEVEESALEGWYSKINAFTSRSLGDLDGVAKGKLSRLNDHAIPFGVVLNYENGAYFILSAIIHEERPMVGIAQRFICYASIVDCLGRLTIVNKELKQQLESNPELVVEVYRRGQENITEASSPISCPGQNFIQKEDVCIKMIRDFITRPFAIVFDMDDTLTPAGRAISDSNCSLIEEYLKLRITIVILTSSSYESVINQVIMPYINSGKPKDLLKNLYILPNNGTQLFKYSSPEQEYREIYRIRLEENLGEEGVGLIKDILREAVDHFGLKKLANAYRGSLFDTEEFIETRPTQVTLVVIGKTASRDAKEAYYGEYGKAHREEIIRFIQEKLVGTGIDITLSAGGKTSIDITDAGIDKGYGIDVISCQLGIYKENIIFFGDGFGGANNDIPVGKKGVGLIVCVGGKPKEGLSFEDRMLISKIKGPEGTGDILRSILTVFGPAANASSPIRLRDDFVKPDAVNPEKKEQESVLNYLNAAKAYFGIDYALVDSTVSGNVVEYNESLHRIDVLKELLARAPPYRQATHASFAFQVVVNDIFRYGQTHTQDASLSYFRANKNELLAYHNWVNVFGIQLDPAYQERITSLENGLFGPVSFKGAIFDMDGVIVDTMPLHSKSWRDTLREEGIHITEEFFDRHFSGVRGEDALKTLFSITGEAQRNILTRRHEAFMHLVLDRGADVYEGTACLIKELSQRNIKCAVATSAGEGHVRVLLNKELIDRFNAIVTGDIVGIGKPYPECFLMAAFKLGLRYEEAVVFEDAKSGIDAAKNGSLRCVGVNRGNADLLDRADLVVDDLSKIGYERLNSLFIGNDHKLVNNGCLVNINLVLEGIKDEASAFCQELIFIYGKANLRLQQERYTATLEEFKKAHPDVRDVCIARAGGRLVISGEHLDYHHGPLINTALIQDIIVIAAVNPKDPKIILNNMASSFTQASIRCAEDIEVLPKPKKDLKWHEYCFAVIYAFMNLLKSENVEIPGLYMLVDGRQEYGGIPIG